MPEVYAGGATIIIRGGDGCVRRPPMPAEFIQGLSEHFTCPAERQRWHRWLVERISWIASKTRDAHHAVVLGEERIKRSVVDRPVLGHTIQSLEAEIGRVQARKMPRVHDRTAAYAVEVHDLDR